MNSTLTQDRRVAKLQTQAGENVLVLTRFDGHEGLSELFKFRIDAYSEEENVDFDKALGCPCSVTCKTYGRERVFHGILVGAEWRGLKDHFHHYRLIARPWLWLLSRTSDCRIFQDMTAPDIVQKVFKDRGFNDFLLRINESYPKLEYCVQYRETDLTFVSRLMEQHGIYYYFEHSAGKHTLVLADSKSSHKAIPALPKIPFIKFGEAQGDEHEYLTDWSSKRRFRTGQIEFNDYNDMTPSADLKSKAKGSAHYNKSDMEIYDYPAKFKVRQDGEKYAKVLLESEQALDFRRYATGDAPSLFPGGLVNLEKHPTGAENDEYLVVRASHSITNQQYRSGAAEEPDEIYSGSYELQPSKRPFRSPIVTPEPLINGIQTAKVVGKEGEEIDVDDHGRILVEFFWVRPDKDTQKKKPSCRVRVAQTWSGKQWGAQVIPRIGMEAVVEFLEGDPDRPLVIGTVYNGEYKVPYPLPANKTQSGIKSDSSKGHGGHNEFKFEDKKSSEKISVHAQKDLELEILDTEMRTIGERFSGPPVGAGSRKTTLVKGDDELEIQTGNQTITIPMGSQSTTAMLSVTHTVGMTTLTLTPATKSVESSIINDTAEVTINLTAGLAVNITAPMINLNGMVLINGMVPMVVPV
jgi:type VI secretion system secreted protein VgrG